ncbi:MAG TPA: MFS transporter, partial [Draconibacterium sp.]|nr:MFS transporter [Draconibacterium sp.]
MESIVKNRQYYKFSSYGFLKNLRFFDAFLLLYLLEKGLPYIQIGILYAIREIFINLFEIPSGLIADTYGRKSTLAGSFVVYMGSFLMFYFAHDFWLFLPAFLLYGAAEAFRSGTHKGMIMDYLKIHDWGDQKITYYGHTRSWSQKGSAISSLVAGIIVFLSGKYDYVFLFSIIPYLLNLFLILSYPKELNREIKHQKYGIKYTLKSFLKIMKKAQVIQIVNTTALHSAFMKAVKDYIQPVMVHLALLLPLMTKIDSEKKNGVVIGIIYFVIYLITARASKISSRIASATNRDIPFYTLLFGFVSGLICGIFYHNQLWLLALVAFIGIYIFENIRKPILTGYISDHVPNEILTSVLSAQSLLQTIIAAILSFVFGLFADLWGIGISFITVTSFLVVFTLILNIFTERKKHS